MPRGKSKAKQEIQLDPSLLSLAAHVQAHHARVQNGGVIDEADALSGQVQLDPTLFAIEEVVNDVRRGKIRLDGGTEHEQPLANLDGPMSSNPNVQAQAPLPSSQHQLHQPQYQHQDMGATIGSSGLQGDNQDVQIHLDDEIDPTLREIVNSLTNAQQSSHVVGPGLSHAQAAAAIGAHLSDAEERERLQQSLQTTLEDLTHASFSSLFPPNFGQSPSQSYLNLGHDPDAAHLSEGHDESIHAGPSTSHDSASSSSRDRSAPPDAMHDLSMHGQIENDESGTDSHKRGRGRPKGSKNKPKAGIVIRPPKPPRPPRRPKGRPPKPRTPEEQADYELRRQEKALGIKRQKGRPRKFPGYLVREMRLKKNRDEFNTLLRGYHGGPSDQEGTGEEGDGGIGGDGMMMEDLDAGHQVGSGLEGHIQHQQLGRHQDPSQHDDSHDHTDFSNWSVQDGQSLLDVVSAGMGGHHGLDVDHVGVGHDGDGLMRGHEGMEGVFGLPSGH